MTSRGEGQELGEASCRSLNRSLHVGVAPVSAAGLDPCPEIQTDAICRPPACPWRHPGTGTPFGTGLNFPLSGPQPRRFRSMCTVPQWDRHLLPSPGQRFARPSPSPPAWWVGRPAARFCKRSLLIPTPCLAQALALPPRTDSLLADLPLSFSCLSSTLRPGKYS